MSKPVKTEAELIAIARTQLKVYADGPDEFEIYVPGSITSAHGSCAPGVDREILSSSSFISADTSANRGVLK